jgi:6-phosphogluconolactonase (cycloisomerase 2 family)
MRMAHARYLVSLGIVILLLTNCSGSTTPATTISQQNAFQTIKHESSPCPCLYAVNQQGNSITVYASGATGNAKPIQDISGSKTGLSMPFGVAVDGSGNIYVTNNGEDSIDIYAAGATGNVAPIRQIIGVPYHYPKGIAIDPINGDIYVAKPLANSIAIFAPSASGKASPIASIQGSQTGLNDPQGVALDTSANIYITNKGDDASTGNDSVTVYAAGSTGNVAPTQTIAGPRTKLDLPLQLALDSSSNIYVANFTYPNSGNGSLTAYAAKANGNVAPIEKIKRAKTELSLPAGIALDGSNNIYAANFDRTNFADSSITVYAAGSNGNVAPINTISGANTGLNGPRGIVIH